MLVSIYTDGAARGNPDGPGGYGTILSYMDSKGEEHIRPHKEQQLVVGVLLAQGAERIDGIALALARHLEVEHLDLDAALKRGLSAHEARHGEAVFVRGAPLLHHLVRRDARRNEQELIQRALLRRLDGGVLVPQMRRVEAAAVNSDLQ